MTVWGIEKKDKLEAVRKTSQTRIVALRREVFGQKLPEDRFAKSQLDEGLQGGHSKRDVQS